MKWGRQVIALITGGSGCGKSTWAEGLAVRLGERRYYLATMPVVDGECEARVAARCTRAQRAGKGLKPSSGRPTSAARRSPSATVLLECLPTLMANEVFGLAGGAPEEVPPYAPGAGAVKLGLTGGAPEELPLMRQARVRLSPAFRAADARSEGAGRIRFLSAQSALPGPESAAVRVLSGVERLAEICQNLVIVTNDVFSDGLTYDPETRAYMRALSRVSRALAARADLVVEVVFSIPVVLKGELR